MQTPVGRPKDLEKRQQILTAVKFLFLKYVKQKKKKNKIKKKEEETKQKKNNN